MLNFTTEIEKYTTVSRSAREKHFMEFTSKKALENAQILTGEEIEFMKEIKGTFSFAVHTKMRYIAVTLYKANAEKKYSFLVVDLYNHAVAEVDSIKTAKAEILKLVEAEETHNEDNDSEEAHTEETIEA